MEPSDIIRFIEKTAPLAAATAWDVSGVQVAALRDAVSHIAVMLDPVPANIDSAIAAGADFILAHHPLSMKPRFPNRNDEYLSVLSRLFSANVWLYGAHTSLDANPRGPVLWLAHELGLRGVQILETTASGALVDEAAASCAASGKTESPANSSTWGSKQQASGSVLQDNCIWGFGFSGDLPEPLPYKEFCKVLATALGKDTWQVCGPRPDVVSRVGCCPGSGGGLATEALRAGVDVFITGDVKYHTALDAQSAGLRVLDVGHFCLEEEMMRRFAVYLKDVCGLPVSFIPSRDPLTAERA